jgi:hypothetical protein
LPSSEVVMFMLIYYYLFTDSKLNRLKPFQFSHDPARIY